MTQVMVETSKGNLEIKALPPPQLPIPVAGGRDHGAAEAGREEVVPPGEDVEAASASAAADSSLKNGFQRATGGEKALETCGTERSGSELMMTGAKAAEAKTERGTIFSEAVDEEERVEVEEKPVGEEMEVVEEHRGVNEADRAFLQFGRNFGRMRQHYLQEPVEIPRPFGFQSG
ncbi:hypothetical protein J1605_011169 [Eschrichtius robustus]|uniref:Uncharacterized protein n=1 Tax=Eschrichtius robustus TaxID=9764 RepID=A0AB34GRV7_ESCRO|nr:hypothetical protein J1605_011169 [Eschrichtius robustus]